jgi:phage shock protein PspC (stress-responsive transcriptional regulator)
MDDNDLNNAIVLTTFAGNMVALVVGYLLAWRSKRIAYRRAGSLMVAVVAGFAGLFVLAYFIASIMPIPSPDGSPVWESLLILLIPSPLPLGAFYICGKFIRHALRTTA